MIPITSLLRVHNEEDLVEDTLKHLESFSDEIFIFDDCSEDRTYEIAKSFSKVKGIIRNHFHLKNQESQTLQRHLLLELAKRNSKNKWFGYFDCDERIEFDFEKLEEYDRQGVSGIFFQLFDSYLTKHDKKPYKQGKDLTQLRRYFGPEYREICFLFNKNKVKYDLSMPGLRQPTIQGNTVVDGFVQHYGKSLSVKKWEEKCDRYIVSMPQLREKWMDRKGKAIHEMSDFRRKLLTWEEIKSGDNSLVKI